MKAEIFCHKLSLFGEDIRVSAAAAADRSAVTRHPLATAARARVGTHSHSLLPSLGRACISAAAAARSSACASSAFSSFARHPPSLPSRPRPPRYLSGPSLPCSSLSLTPSPERSQLYCTLGWVIRREEERDGTTEVGSIVVCGGGGGGSPLSRRGREEGSSSSTGRLEARIGGPDCAQHLHERRGRTKKCRLSG